MQQDTGHKGMGYYLGWLVCVVAMAGMCSCISYPDCETDEHCAEKGEYCLNKKCQQCRVDSHCKRGDRCASGICDKIPDWCESVSDCSGNKVCLNNRCRLECSQDSDCGSGKVCSANRCKDQCVTDADCSSGQTCSGGRCVAPLDACDNLAAVHFDYDEYTLRKDARDALASHSGCLKKRDRSLRIEGHCDERGTEEYNIALGEQRANASRRYLQKMGAKYKNLSIVSYGESRPTKYGHSESAWALNRRCEFVWQ